MKDNKKNIANMVFSAEDLKKEHIITLYSYLDIVNRLLKIVIPVIGIDTCEKVLSQISLKHKILKNSKITDDKTLICPSAKEILSKETETTAVAVIISAFYMFISKVKNIYVSMSSPELGIAALILAATGASKESLITIEKTKKELESQVEKRTTELTKKIHDLEKFRKLTVNRELRMIELKKKMNDLSKDLDKSKKR
ncbi:MAG: hypothetical protein KAI70_06320 [Candidatus Omnitrophica bacterium]|nr:hypothetical protein [Candidatus Omnitrophota bacterium]